MDGKRLPRPWRLRRRAQGAPATCREWRDQAYRDGLYDKPTHNPLTQQTNPPDPRSVIDAVARRNQIRVLVDGMTAANDIGLTNAVPARIVVHTDARLRPIKLGNLTIDFKPTAASKLYWAGRPAMRVVQALHWLRDVLADADENRRVSALLKRLFSNGQSGKDITDDLRQGLGSLPIWMQTCCARCWEVRTPHESRL